MDKISFPPKYETLLPLIFEWAKEQEQLILKNGVPLTVDQKIDAHLIGVKDIERVRLLKVDRIPSPRNRQLIQAMKSTGLVATNTIGITFRYGICIQSKFWDNRKLVIHELTHTMQYERCNGIQEFLKQYLMECLTIGYPHGPLEQEAKNNETKIV